MINEQTITAGNLRFDCRISGNETDDLVLFLHGFPETSHMWKKLLPEISKLGFYCIAPNLRGYSKGARPRGKKQYTIDKLSQDVLNIAKAVGKAKFHLVGHDWGAAIGWYTVFTASKNIQSFTALSVPHLQAFDRARQTNADQQHKSRYIKNFQWPFLPEHSMKRNNFKLLRKVWRESSEDEVEDYLIIFKQKYAVTAALNYYRANYRMSGSNNSQKFMVKVSTLFIWGVKDRFIGPAGVKASHEYMDGDYKFVKLNAGHWLVQTKYDEIKTEISEHLLKFK